MRITSKPRAPEARAEFERFVAGSADPLLRTAYLVVWDLAEAEDLVQECMFAVARRWPRVRRMDHPRAYARRILINLALDGARNRARRRAELTDLDLPEPADERAARLIGCVEDRSELLPALALLPPRQRAVLVLRYFDDLTEGQVADALGCSVGTVKSTAFKALERLRGTLSIEPTTGAHEDARATRG